MATNSRCPTTRLSTLSLGEGFETTYTSVGDSSKPLLLLVVGSSGVGSLWRQIANHLSQSFRCVYYDKRGFLPLDSDLEWAVTQKNQVISVKQQADDAAILITHLSPSMAAYVFGTSCGATEVLDLVIRYPELVRLAILHEPMTFSVIRDDQLRNEMLDLYRVVGNSEDTIDGHTIFRNYMFNPPQKASATITSAAGPPAPRNAVELFNSRGGQCEALAMVEYQVDETKARAVSHKILLVAGKNSADLQVSKPSASLAGILGEKMPLRKLPGGHMDFASKAFSKEFCGQLLFVLREERLLLKPEEEKERSKM